MSLEALRNLVKCIGWVPLGVIGLMTYAALTSTFVFPEDVDYIQRVTPWHPAYFNKFDLLLLGAMLMSCFLASLIPDRRTVALLLFALGAIALSIACHPGAPLGALQDGMLQWVRFASVFVFARELTRRIGSQPVESLLYLLFSILAASSVFVYLLRYHEFQRFYAAGMTVGSFAQVSVVVSLIALGRRQYVVLLVGIVFLALTASLTSTILFVVIAFLIPLSSSGTEQHHAAVLLKRRIRQVCLTAGALASFALAAFAVAEVGAYDLNPEEFGHMHGRRDIWEFATKLILHGHVGILGIGFGRSPEFLQSSSLLREYASEAMSNTHFHSIVFEGVIGLGVLCVPLFIALVRRIGRSWRQAQYLPCAVFLFFLLSQCIDFSVYRPKEIVLWAFMLGLADGDVRHHAAINQACRR